MLKIAFYSLARDDPEEARYYANTKKTAMTLFHVVSISTLPRAQT